MFSKACSVFGESKIELKKEKNLFKGENLIVTVDENGTINIKAKNHIPMFIILEKYAPELENTLICGDAWERAYGDLEWKKECSDRIMPWYFSAYSGERVYCFGIETGASAFCSWQYSKEKITLTVDIRCGNEAISTPEINLNACRVVCGEYTVSPFEAVSDFCKKLCPSPKTAPAPVFGGNDWYCNYGDNSYEKIIEHTKRIVECSPKGIKPYMVIDDGWEEGAFSLNCAENMENVFLNCGPWSLCNDKFKDMKKLAEEISALGAIPGIWIRPLFYREGLFDSLAHKKTSPSVMLDPSKKEVLEIIKKDISAIKSWGYKLIKTDFLTYDITKNYGFEMNLFGGETVFSDKSKTTAQIIKNLYKTIKKAAGDEVLIIGCNAVSHLAAGIFEIQRTGDDTSGKEWERTKTYGINTLAFRMPQHNTFYTADADCVGITADIPWDKNKQWLDLLSKSGTALFVSIGENSYSEEVRKALKAAFKNSAENRSPSIPEDWLENRLPKKWKSYLGYDEYTW